MGEIGSPSLITDTCVLCIQKMINYFMICHNQMLNKTIKIELTLDLRSWQYFSLSCFFFFWDSNLIFFNYFLATFIILLCFILNLLMLRQRVIGECHCFKVCRLL